VKLAPPPRPKGKPSMSEYLGRGFKPSDEISRPSRRELEDALDRAGKMATARHRSHSTTAEVSQARDRPGWGSFDLGLRRPSRNQ
jgi:hypothetical protein